MPSDNDDLVCQIGSRDFPDHVVVVGIGVVDAVPHLHLEPDGNAPFEDPVDPVVVFGGNHHLRQAVHDAFIAAVRPAVVPAAHEQDPVVSPSAPDIHNKGHALGLHEFVQIASGDRLAALASPAEAH